MDEYREVVLDGELSLDVSIDGDIDLLIPLDGEVGTVTEVWKSLYPYYDGQTEFTPSAETQTVATEGSILLADIKINPIPSNYGLVSWSGLGIRIS